MVEDVSEKIDPLEEISRMSREEPLRIRRRLPWGRAGLVGGGVAMVALLGCAVWGIVTLGQPLSDESGVQMAGTGTGIVEVPAVIAPRPEPQPQPAKPTPEPQPVPNTGEVKPVKGRVAYLTFDDGPSRYTQGILDVLRANSVKATFFVTGRMDYMYKTIVAAGHGIGLHSNSHNYAQIYRSDQAFLNDLAAVSRRVERQVGVTPKIMRFPGGSSNTVSRHYSRGIMRRLVGVMHQRGYRIFDWNCATGDGNIGVTVASEVRAVAGCRGEKLYILAHDTSQATVTAMRTILPALKRRGYIFRVIDETTPEQRHRVNN